MFVIIEGWRNISPDFAARCEAVTYCMVQSLEKPTGLQLVKTFPAFHGTWRFITALTSVRHLSLSWASQIQSIYPRPTSWRSVLILSTHLRLGLPSGSFPPVSPTYRTKIKVLTTRPLHVVKEQRLYERFIVQLWRFPHTQCAIKNIIYAIRRGKYWIQGENYDQRGPLLTEPPRKLATSAAQALYIGLTEWALV